MKSNIKFTIKLIFILSFLILLLGFFVKIPKLLYEICLVAFILMIVPIVIVIWREGRREEKPNHTQPEDINSQEGVELQPSAVQVETSGRDFALAREGERK